MTAKIQKGKGKMAATLDDLSREVERLKENMAESMRPKSRIEMDLQQLIHENRQRNLDFESMQRTLREQALLESTAAQRHAARITLMTEGLRRGVALTENADRLQNSSIDEINAALKMITREQEWQISSRPKGPDPGTAQYIPYVIGGTGGLLAGGVLAALLCLPASVGLGLAVVTALLGLGGAYIATQPATAAALS